MSIKRLRLFAGPNGSGKTTILKQIQKKIDLGYVVNADDIESSLLNDHCYQLTSQNITTNTAELQEYFKKDGFSVHKLATPEFIEEIAVNDNNIHIPIEYVNSYTAADIAGFLRIKHIENNHTFTFESVLSHPSKLELLIKAKSEGYRIYLYYIATESDEINVNRVKIRVQQQGHNVPDDAVISRYIKSLSLLYDVIRISDRAYIFDNSGRESIYFAEITNGEDAILHCTEPEVPNWFYTYVINRIQTGNF